MTWLIALTVCLALFCWLMWTARKGGKDSVKAKAAENSLEQIRKAHVPLHDDELERVRRKWRVD